MTDDLVAFLRARLDEDQRTAEATLWDGSGNTPDWNLPASATLDTGGDTIHVNDATIARHIARHDPAHVLRDIAAKRRRLEALAEAAERGVYITALYTAEDALRDEAAVYADHPEFKDEWRPAGPV